jgi:exocyst complex component 4
VDHMFIHAARSVTVINLAGVQKIKRNILSLQQTLRAIQGTDDGILSRSIQFWDMYEKGPKVRISIRLACSPAGHAGDFADFEAHFHL